MRRVLKWIFRILAVLVALPILAVVLVLIALNTAPGQNFLAGEVGSLTGGMVRLTGLHGGLPGAPRIDRIEIADTQGVWLTVEGLALDWSPLALASLDADVQRLSATRVAVARLPVSQPATQPAPAGGQPFQLPVRMDVAALHVDRVEVAAPVAGTAVAASLDASAQVASLQQGQADVTLRAAGGAGTYHVQGNIDPATIRAALAVDEPPQGIIHHFANLPPTAPQLGALTVRGSLDGPWTGAATALTVSAGDLGADAHGTLDLRHVAGNLTLYAHAPALTPAPGVSFQAAALRAHVSGPLATPDASATLRVSGLSAGGAAVHLLTADVSGDRGHITLKAASEGTRIPGPRPDLVEADPIRLTADAKLADPARPVVFDIAHPLLHVSGTAQTGGTISAKAHAEAPDLAPLAAIGAVDLQGRTALDITAGLPNGETHVTVDGSLGLTGGMPQAVALIGPEGRIGVTAALHGQDVTVSRLQVNGRDVSLNATAALVAQKLEATADISVADLHAVQPTVQGGATLHAHAAGALDALAVQADLSGDVATKGVPKGHVEAKVDARGLPGAPEGHVQASGQLDGAPVSLSADARHQADGTLSVTIDRGDWKSAHADGAFTLAKGATLPTGHLALRMARLDDLRRLTGQALTGSVDAQLALDTGSATARIRASGAGLPGTAAVRALALDARVNDPLGARSVDATLTADGVQAGKISGSARVRVAGPQTALAITAQASAQGIAGGPAQVATQATLDVPGQNVRVASLSATVHAETVRLLAPVKISFGNTVAVDRLRVGLRNAVLDVAGRVQPTLDLTASLRNVTADLARIADPSVRAAGTLSVDARLTGTPARPSGTVHLAASGLRMLNGPAASLPAAAITADVRLAGQAAQVNARLAAGRNAFSVSGTAPIDPAASMNLRATGGLDLTLLDPILTAQGRRVRGQLSLDATVTGPLAAPRASGQARLDGGEVQDFAQGARISDIAAVIQAEGDHVQITRFTGNAGKGTISATGSIGLAAPMPVDLHLTMNRASPLSSDRLTAVLDSDLSLRGQLAGRLDAAGRITVQQAEIQIPEHLPASIAVLDVRVPGQKPPPPPAPGPDIGLDVSLHSPGRIFVRGRGIDAELQGDLHVGGTAAQPRPEGGFQMRRGSISVAGTTLTFSTGKVTFDGSGKLDPVLDFIANSTSGNVTATLEVTGYASAPKIKLSSVPDLPQDEVLAHLLFGKPASSLGPFQLGEIALALAQLTGVGGGGADPLGAARKALGLDRLSVGGGSGGSSGGATVEAGRYVAPGVYVGAKQGTSGGGTQAEVQIDLYKGLKLDTTVGTGGGSAQGSSGSSQGTGVGLTYQFEY